MKFRAFSSQVVFDNYFPKSILGLPFWTFINVHFRKPNHFYKLFLLTENITKYNKYLFLTIYRNNTNKSINKAKYIISENYLKKN